MSGSRWTEERAAEWFQGRLQGEIKDHQVYYLKCLGTGPEATRWLDGTDARKVALAAGTTWPNTGTRWRAHRFPDGSWGFRCLADRAGDRWLDGRTPTGTVGFAPNPRYPFTGAHWQVVPVDGGHALKCLGEAEGEHKRFLDGVTSTASTALAANTEAPYTGTHWELRPEQWLVGCNFIPSTADNQLEMWQRDTFDLATIRRELEWAQNLGFNAVRVFLHDLLWADASAFLERVAAYLHAADEHGIATLFVFFDDCWNTNPKPGTQPAPFPDAHNSQWVQSPGKAVVSDPSGWPRLKDYVQGVLRAFAYDRRVFGWDLYNEPGGGLEGPNCERAPQSLPLLEQVFAWARDVLPSQPLTSGVWNKACGALRDFQLNASDIITFHRYADPSDPLVETVPTDIAELRTLRRPVVCTEYMARPLNSRFENHLALFNDSGVGCFNWGLVAGKTQTFLPWGWAPRCEWFHDVVHAWGTAYSESEVAIVRCLTGKEPSGVGIQHNAVYQLKCLGHIEGDRWLDGKTTEGKVDLAPSTESPYTGTSWRAVQQMNGVFAFYCMGAIDAPTRWLNGKTADGAVDLAPEVSDAYTGAAWHLCHVRDDVYICRCLGDLEGPRLLNGRTGEPRTAERRVELTPHTGTGITGIQWQLVKVSDG